MSSGTIGNSKALVAALFIQYIPYAIFYIMDEFKLDANRKPPYY